MANSLFQFEAPQQGISLSFTREEAAKFLVGEQTFFSEFQQIFAEGTQWLGNNYGNLGLPERAISDIGAVMRAVRSGGGESEWNRYVEEAKTLQITVGQGELGRRAKELRKRGENLTAKWILIIYSPRWLDDDAKRIFAPVLAMGQASPANILNIDLITSKTATDDAIASRELAEKSRDDFDKYVTEKTELIDGLARRYREHITVEKPAQVWSDQYISKTRQWRLWLGIFAVLVILPLCEIWVYHEELTKWVLSLSAGSNGGLSLGAVATLTLPALLYGWLLRLVSRLFIQNLSLADDAVHRKVLAATYLGLVENKDVGTTKEDRVLILNALFRPLPNGPADEGPPLSLVELMIGKGKT